MKDSGENHNSLRIFLFMGLIMAAGIFLAAGIAKGQPADVLSKAATICLECVGIG